MRTNSRKYCLLMGALQYVIFLIGKVPSHHLRAWLFSLMGMKIGRSSVIYGGARIRSPWHIVIGNGVAVGDGTVLDGRAGLIIKDRVNISSDVVILTMQHDHRSRSFDGTRGPVVIEEYVWLGVRSIVLPGVTITKGCVIAAGAIITRDTEPYGVYAGVPARRIGERPQDLDYVPGDYPLSFI